MPDLSPVRRNGPPVDPDEAAAWWSSRRRLGLTSARDEAAFGAWMADPAHAAAFERADRPMEALGDLAAAPEIRRMREMALAAQPARHLLPVKLILAGGLAAALVAAALLAVNARPERTGALDAPDAVTMASADGPSLGRRYETAVGERQDVTLDDGSVVSLNTNSVIEVAYNERRRDVRLLRGQALFRVAHNPARPFVVSAGDRRIVARGTAFDVRVDGDDVKVVLLEGRVEVSPARPSGIGRFVPIVSRQDLSPGEQLVSAPNVPVRVTAADVEQATSWRRGQVVFHDDTLADAIAEMNRYSDTKLIIDDPRVAALRISGVFGVARPENFQAAISAYHPVDIEPRSEKVRVLAWRTAG